MKFSHVAFESIPGIWKGEKINQSLSEVEKWYLVVSVRTYSEGVFEQDLDCLELVFQFPKKLGPRSSFPVRFRLL